MSRGLLASLKGYCESSRGARLRTEEETEDEIQAKTQLAMVSSSSGQASSSRSSQPAIPSFYTPKPKLDSVKALVDAEANQRALVDRAGALLDTACMEDIWYMLLEQAQENAEDSESDKRINYDDFTQVRDRCQEDYGSLCNSYFRATTFGRFPRDSHGCISVNAFYQYIMQRNQQERMALALTKYDGDRDGFLTVEELEAWIGEQVAEGSIQHLVRIDSYFITQYKHICAHKFAFFHAKRGKMRIRDLVGSPVMIEWLCVAQPKTANPRLATNWFSLLSTNRVYKQFSSLDQNMTGSLGQEDLAKYSKTMTKLFVSRIFEEHVGRSRSRGGPRGSGKMVFQEFLDFVLAWDNKNSAPSIRYFFAVYDLKKVNFLTSPDIYTFFIEVYKLWVDLGYYTELSIGDVTDEIFDMVKPRDELAITVEDLLDCKVGGTVMTMLADVTVFWEYDNRESLMQHDDDEAEGI